MEYFFFWIVLTFVVGAIGSGRKIGFFGAFIISLFLSPLIGLIVVFASKSKADEKFQQDLLQAQKVQNNSPSERLDTPSSIGSIDDELRRLKTLKDDGLITDDEFQKLRQNLFKE